MVIISIITVSYILCLLYLSRLFKSVLCAIFCEKISFYYRASCVQHEVTHSWICPVFIICNLLLCIHFIKWFSFQKLQWFYTSFAKYFFWAKHYYFLFWSFLVYPKIKKKGNKGLLPLTILINSVNYQINTDFTKV